MLKRFRRLGMPWSFGCRHSYLSLRHFAPPENLGPRLRWHVRSLESVAACWCRPLPDQVNDVGGNGQLPKPSPVLGHGAQGFLVGRGTGIPRPFSRLAGRPFRRFSTTATYRLTRASGEVRAREPAFASFSGGAGEDRRLSAAAGQPHCDGSCEVGCSNCRS